MNLLIVMVFQWLQGLDCWSFDVFGLNEVATDQVLKYVGYELLTRYGLVHKFKVRN